MSYIIGSFNLQNFSGKDRKDLDVIANIITTERLDIIALQEVLRPEALNSLLRRLPYYWEGVQCSPRTSKEEAIYDEKGDISTPTIKRSSNTAKGYAFIWNSRRVRECSRSGPQVFKQIKNGELVRNPFYGRFTPSGLPGGAFFEIRLINVHLCSPAEPKANRLKEYSVATQEVYTRISKKRYGDNMPSYTIILGDYNMPITWCSEANNNFEGQIICTDQEEKTTLSTNINQQKESKKGILASLLAKERQAPSQEQDPFANDYDHFSFDMYELLDIELKIERINSVEKYYQNDFVEYKKKVSDHVPIKMEIMINENY
jgi:endonuclease/exonuclease/phosphatase family metal-dependent hydrolase